MKKQTTPILTIAVIALLRLSACVKTKTCTCKDSNGTVVSQVTKKTTSRSEIQKFEDDCNKSKTTNGTTTTPCTLS